MPGYKMDLENAEKFAEMLKAAGYQVFLQPNQEGIIVHIEINDEKCRKIVNEFLSSKPMPGLKT